MADQEAVLAVVHAHLDAFNTQDLEAVLATFADEAVFSTGLDVVIGHRAIRALFTDAFAAPFDARLELRTAVVAGETVACELLEHLVVDATSQTVPLAAFYTIRDGGLARVKVYREGSADIA